MNNIYFIEQDGQDLVKIGLAKNIKNRFSSLQTSCPQNLKLRGYIKGSYDKETELHILFSKFNVSGEWFILSEEILDYIDKNCFTDLNDDINNNRSMHNKDSKLMSFEGGSEFNIVYRNRLEDVSNMKLTTNEKLVYYILREFAQYPTNCIVIKDHIPSIKEFEPLVGLTDRSIGDALITLEKKNLIKRKQYGHKKAIYINPEYYATGKDLDIDTLKMFNLIDYDEDKVNEYIDYSKEKSNQ